MFLAVNTYFVGGIVSFATPLILPVVLSNINPLGKSGLIINWFTVGIQLGPLNDVLTPWTTLIAEFTVKPKSHELINAMAIRIY